MNTILVIDDEPSLRKTLRQALLGKGFVALEAANCRDGIYAATAHTPDLIVCDIEMPDGTGHDVFDALKENPTTSTIPFIFVTGKNDPNELRHSMEQGADDFLVKPFRMESLLAAVEINTPTQFIGDNLRFMQDVFNDLRGLSSQLNQLLEAARGHAFAPGLMEQIEKTIQTVNLVELEKGIPKSITQALSGVQRVAEIVQAMKDFSHPGTESKMPVDLNRAIESTLTVCRNEWKYVADLQTDFDPSLPLVACLPGEFNQAILNIVVNAESARASKSNAWENMTRFSGRYDPRVVEAVASVFDDGVVRVLPVEAQGRPVGIKNLRVGLTLAAEACTKDGVLIVPAGTQISPMLIEKLRNFAELGDLEEPMLVTDLCGSNFTCTL